MYVRACVRACVDRCCRRCYRRCCADGSGAAAAPSAKRKRADDFINPSSSWPCGCSCGDWREDDGCALARS
eukprot:2693174-Prymnesium_polylepis.2